MKSYSTLKDTQGIQVVLFPLNGFIISQAWYESYSHNQNSYYASDFLATDENGNRLFRAPCYAPVDIKLLWKDPVECCALWQSVEKVHFADGSYDYLGLICYHDNDIANGTYKNVGDVVLQGQIFNRSGTGGNVTGDHLHLETGIGQVTLGQSNWHFKENTSCKRIIPDKALFVNDTFITPKANYNWKKFEGSEIVPVDPVDPIDPRNYN